MGDRLPSKGEQENPDLIILSSIWFFDPNFAGTWFEFLRWKPDRIQVGRKQKLGTQIWSSFWYDSDSSREKTKTRYPNLIGFLVYIYMLINLNFIGPKSNIYMYIYIEFPNLKSYIFFLLIPLLQSLYLSLLMRLLMQNSKFERLEDWQSG